MAMVKYGPGIVEIEGRVGGEYYRHDQCVNHIQAMPRVVERHKISPQQNAFHKAQILWSSHEWTDEEISQWWVWCYNHPMKNKKNEIIYYHPFLAFLHINIKRKLNGLEMITTPPP